MKPFYAYWIGEAHPGEYVSLSAEESHHLLRVLRVRLGALVFLFDGKGKKWKGVLVGNGSRAKVEIREVVPVGPPPRKVLIQSLPKGHTMDVIVRHATEIGVREIVPVLAERSAVRLDAAGREQKRMRWEKIAREACKQSENVYLPSIAPIESLGEWLEGKVGLKVLVASLEKGAKDIASALGESEEVIGVLVGPEGDFTSEEYERIGSFGGVPVRLARTILRCETAALYALSVIDALTFPAATHSTSD